MEKHGLAKLQDMPIRFMVDEETSIDLRAVFFGSFFVRTKKERRVQA